MKAKELAEILLKFPDKEVMTKKFFIEGDYDSAVDFGTVKIVPLNLSDCENLDDKYIINNNILTESVEIDNKCPTKGTTFDMLKECRNEYLTIKNFLLEFTKINFEL